MNKVMQQIKYVPEIFGGGRDSYRKLQNDFHKKKKKEKWNEIQRDKKNKKILKFITKLILLWYNVFR